VTRALLATDAGVLIADAASDWTILGGGGPAGATSVAAASGVVLAGHRDGIHRSLDDGVTWRPSANGLVHRHVRWLALAPDAGLALAGTEPAGIFLSHDMGESWRGCPEVSELRDRLAWFLPYSPEAGCVRGFALALPDRAYAAVEVGGVLVSSDGGTRWALPGGSSGVPSFGQPAPGHIHPDVHSLVPHPHSPEAVVAATNSGIYVTDDAGESWRLAGPASYTRAVWVDPGRPDRWVAGPARNVDVDGTIAETLDGGATWRDASAGTDAPWPGNMVERLAQVGDELIAVMAEGGLLATPVAECRWRPILPGAPAVRAVAAL
jgi:photosystem II stability/assembly factor-like uncharacterized protein